MKSNYNKFPSTKIKGHEHAAVVGYNNILDTLKKEIPSGKYVITCDVYPGVRDEEILTELKKLEPSVLINMIDVFKEEKTITEQLKYILTDDRVFGKMYYGEVSDFIDIVRVWEIISAAIMTKTRCVRISADSSLNGGLPISTRCQCLRISTG